MNLVAALILFNILILVYQIIIEIFTILCRINGISLDKSKFQVISLLTGTGFTTSESEAMLLTKSRRKLTQRIMLFSYIFNISIVSIFVNIFISTANTSIGEIKIGVIFTIINMILIIVLNKSKMVRKILDTIILKIANSAKYRYNNFVSIYDTYGNKVIAEIELKMLREDMKYKTIEELQIKKKYNIQILVLKRKDTLISEIWPNTVIQEGDTIIVFGRYHDIKEAFVKHMDKIRWQKENEKETVEKG